MTLDELKQLRGLVATVCLSGTVDPDYAMASSDLRAYNITEGFTAVEYAIYNAVLVETGRDAAVQHALSQDYEWILQIDADAAPFPPQLLHRMLELAFQPNGPDVVGAYAQLKGPPHLPTIDTGTGTWELHYPGEGVLPVVRTGCHAFLTKTHVFKAFGPPWFRTRIPMIPLMAMRDLDNFARLNRDGINPLRGPEWDSLMRTAIEQNAQLSMAVGEDSSFFDTINALGFRVVVDTNLVVGHVSRKIIQPKDLIDAFKERDRRLRAGVGLYE